MKFSIKDLFSKCDQFCRKLTAEGDSISPPWSLISRMQQGEYCTFVSQLEYGYFYVLLKITSYRITPSAI